MNDWIIHHWFMFITSETAFKCVNKEVVGFVHRICLASTYYVEGIGYRGDEKQGLDREIKGTDVYEWVNIDWVKETIEYLKSIMLNKEEPVFFDKKIELPVFIDTPLHIDNANSFYHLETFIDYSTIEEKDYFSLWEADE